MCFSPSIDVDTSISIIPHTRLTPFVLFFFVSIYCFSMAALLVPLILLSLSNRVLLFSCYRYLRSSASIALGKHHILVNDLDVVFFLRPFILYYPLYPDRTIPGTFTSILSHTPCLGAHLIPRPPDSKFDCDFQSVSRVLSPQQED